MTAGRSPFPASAARAVYRRLASERLERLSAIDKLAPGLKIRGSFVASLRVAQVGAWWPALARLIQRYREWKSGRRTPCEHCGELTMSRDLEIANTEMVCSLCRKQPPATAGKE